MPAVSLSVVAFALVAALSWGVADFGGGFTSRRGPFFGVLFFSQLIGLVVAGGLVAVSREVPLRASDVSIAAVAGVVGTTGLICLYRGLSVGRTNVVAPVSGVLAAGIPVIFGIWLEGVPPGAVLVGIALAIAAVILVSLSADPGSERPSGILWALGAGIAIGAFSTVISRLSADAVFWPMVIVRSVQCLVLVALILATRSAWRLPRDIRAQVALVGLLDMVGNAAYLKALSEGALAVAAVISSLFPVVTVILAIVLLHERLTRSHAVGIVAAAVAIALISAGTAA